MKTESTTIMLIFIDLQNNVTSQVLQPKTIIVVTQISVFITRQKYKMKSKDVSPTTSRTTELHKYLDLKSVLIRQLMISFQYSLPTTTTTALWPTPATSF